MPNKLLDASFISKVANEHVDSDEKEQVKKKKKSGFTGGDALRIAALGAGGFMDFDSTRKALSLNSPNLSEGNPIAGERPSLLKLGLIKGAGNAGMGMLTHNMAKSHPKAATALAIGLGALQAGIGMRNYKLYNKYKDK